MFTSASPELFLMAYRQAAFPMAEDAHDPAYDFYQPHERALLPIRNLHISRSLMKAVQKPLFTVTVDTAFEDVIAACAAPGKGRETSWINAPIRDTFIALHQEGYAHSVECWQNGILVGGLYGLAIGQVFCGESMFSAKSNASKVALVHLCARLYAGGFKILDTQFANPHMRRFGLYEIPHEEYEEIIGIEMDHQADFILSNQSENQLLKNYFAARGAEK
jgi:leucyl/phenylalanyl-tRNA--protein transferase